MSILLRSFSCLKKRCIPLLNDMYNIDYLWEECMILMTYERSARKASCIVSEVCSVVWRLSRHWGVFTHPFSIRATCLFGLSFPVPFPPSQLWPHLIRALGKRGNAYPYSWMWKLFDETQSWCVCSQGSWALRTGVLSVYVGARRTS